MSCLHRFSGSCGKKDRMLWLFLGMFINLATFQKQQKLHLPVGGLPYLDAIVSVFIDAHLLIPQE